MTDDEYERMIRERLDKMATVVLVLIGGIILFILLDQLGGLFNDVRLETR